MASAFDARPSRPRAAGGRIGRLLVSAALVPLLQAGGAFAETKISSAATDPVFTSTAAGGQPDDVLIEAAGSVKIGAPGAAVVVDSDSKVTNQGTIAADEQSDSTGILVTSVRTGRIENSGLISLSESFTGADADQDGDLDGAFAQGAGRYGIRVAGPGPFFGDIVNGVGGSITVEGNDSAGVLVEGRLQGDLVNSRTISVLGDRSTGVKAGDVAGSVRLNGSISAVGEGATAVDLGVVAGAVVIQGGVGATGYRTVERLADDPRKKLDADDLKLGGAAVRIGGDVWGGVLLDRRPADNDPAKDDEDGDGIKDADEGVAVVTSSGSAPALDVGGAGPVRLGRVGTGDSAFGLVIKGQVIGAGVNDGVSATAVRIGQPGGGPAVLEGGLHLVSGGGSIQAGAFEADATAVQLNAGADVPELRIGGDLGAKTTSGGAVRATGLMIEAGASAPVLTVSGRMAVEVAGAAGLAQAVVDRSGTLARIENSGLIQASVTPPSGSTAQQRAVAIDVRANGSGVLLRQTGAEDAAPAIVGDVLLGSGADRLEILRGSLTGAIAFGAGADSLVIDGGATVAGPVSDADGSLALDVRKGALRLEQTGPLRVSSVSLGDAGRLDVTIDPATGAFTRLEASGAATVATGAKVDIRITSLLEAPAQYEILKAGSLSAGSLDGGLVGAPFLYAASLRADAAAGSLVVEVRRRTAAEAGLNRSEAQAYDAVFEALDSDAPIRDAFLSKTDQAGFVALYDQMLPDHSGGALMSAAAISTQVSSAVSEHAGRTTDVGPGGRLWAQEIFFRIDRRRSDAMGFASRGFGVAGGVEQVFADDSAYGLSLSFVTADFHDRRAAAGEQVSMSFGQAGVYVRQVLGDFRADVRAAVGFVTFDSDRRIVSEADELDRTSTADWNGWLVDAHAGLSYEARLGPFYAAPQAAVDYLRLQEGKYSEEGGGAGVDLSIDGRRGDLLLGSAVLALGARFGGGWRWGPEVKFGWRERLAGAPGRTTARFLGGGRDFVLDAENPYQGGAIARMALKGAGGGVTAALEGGGEFGDGYEQYDVRAVVKFNF